MKPALVAFLSFLFLVAVLMVLGTALFVGFGALLARWLPLNLFQASVLAIGAAIALAAILYVLSTLMHTYRTDEPDDDFQDEEDDLEPDATESETSFTMPDFSKTSRNDYCPCGSGRKFKNCCEKRTLQ